MILNASHLNTGSFARQRGRQRFYHDKNRRWSGRGNLSRGFDSHHEVCAHVVAAGGVRQCADRAADHPQQVDQRRVCQHHRRITGITTTTIATARRAHAQFISGPAQATTRPRCATRCSKMTIAWIIGWLATIARLLLQIAMDYNLGLGLLTVEDPRATLSLQPAQQLGGDATAPALAADDL
eukprot:COSAG01_NODE_4939_length_4608_cov_66.819694_3_plen_182_part_00